MPYFVYILKSRKDNSYYKGFSENPLKRLEQHNNGMATYTSTKVPWELVFLQSFETKSDALKREKSVKKYSPSQIENLINSQLNELEKFSD